jgi:hypothetical protein
MGIPQVPEHVRRAPALALRAVFAGIGRILLSADRPEALVPTPPAQAGAPSLPLDNYDSLSLASIRARLRSLDSGQLKVLLDYEAVNAERPEVLGMLERRIEKLGSAL